MTILSVHKLLINNSPKPMHVVNNLVAKSPITNPYIMEFIQRQFYGSTIIAKVKTFLSTI